MEGDVPPKLVSPRVRGFMLGIVVGALVGALGALAVVVAWGRIWEDDTVFDPSTTDYRGVVVEPIEPGLLCIELTPAVQHGESDTRRCAPSVTTPAIGTTVEAVLADWCADEYEDCSAMWLVVDEV